MTRIAIIGGTGLTSLTELKNLDYKSVDTPYGMTSGSLLQGNLDDTEVIFLCRHGDDHEIPPHKINYRANIWALHSIDVTHIIAVSSVGGINRHIPPKKIIIPDQVIDYTYSRKHTFFEGTPNPVTHIDFTHPYCVELRQNILQAAQDCQLDICTKGVYGATQGPRLETAAEINRMERDGCDIVGMTGMPEAALAKELAICYATISLCANWAAGRSEDEISIDEIRKTVEVGMQSVKQLLSATLKKIK